MAIYTITVIRDAGGFWVIDTNGANLAELDRGDKLRFERGAGSLVGTISISGFNSQWTSSSSVTVPAFGAGYVERQVNVTATDGYNGNLNFTYNGGSSHLESYTISVADTTPNQFTFVDVTGQDPNANFTAQVQVTDFNRELDVVVSATNGYTVEAVAVRGTRIIRPAKVIELDTVRISGLVPNAYNQSYTVTVTIGNTVDSFVVSTRAEPEIQQLIQMEIFSPAEILIKRDLYAFFGGRADAKPFLSDYCRGAGYVPDISANSGIPTSTPIDITDLYGAYTAYYFTKAPVSKEAQANTLNGQQEISVAWDKRPTTAVNLHDWELGFGDNLEQVAQYRYTIYRQDTYPTNDIVINSNNPSYNNFNTDNTYINLSATVPQGQERIYYGTLKIEARNSVAGAQRTISRTVDWSLIFYGP